MSFRSHVRVRSDITCDQIWQHIIEQETVGKPVTEVSVPYTEKSVYYYWHVISQDYWRLDPDPLESAKKFVVKNSAKHFVALLDIEAELGTEVMAFEVSDFIASWAKHTQELGMDSTCACSLFPSDSVR